jgi:uncharacterized tellurite resistance protein B-like protein
MMRLVRFRALDSTNTNYRERHMSIAKLTHVLKIFGGAEPSPEEEHKLVKETLMMTLARASSADSSISPVEVETVREIIKRVTGDDVSSADVRVAAHAELFETTPLTTCLSRIGGKLKAKDRVMVVQSLAEVIRSDVEITAREVAFFDGVANALKVTPAELAGLIPA